MTTSDRRDVPATFEPVDELAMNAPQAETWPEPMTEDERRAYWERQQQYAEENRRGGHP